MKFIKLVKKYVSERKYPEEFTLFFDASQEALDCYHRSLECYLYTSVEIDSKTHSPSISIKKGPLVRGYLYEMRQESTRNIIKKIKRSFLKKQKKAVIFDVGGSASYCTDVLIYEPIVVFDRFDVVYEGSGGGGWQIALLEAQKRKRKNLSYVYAEAGKLPTKNEKADLIICSELFEHLPSDTIRFQVLKEIKRVLKRKGILLFTTPNTSDIIGRYKSLIKDMNFSHHGVWNDKRMVEVMKENDFEIIAISGTLMDWIFLQKIVDKFWPLIFMFRFIDKTLDIVPFGWKLKHNTIIVARNC